MLLSISEVAILFGVCIETIRRWDFAGKLIPSLRTIGGHRRYESNYIQSIIKQEPIESTKYTVCYSRVSTHDQKDDLIRQNLKLINYAEINNFKNIKSIKDLGSGLNYKKKGLLDLLNLLLTNQVDTIILDNKDRLLRFGAEITLYICKQKNIKVIILEDKELQSKEEEFVFDVLSILTVYTSKIYGSRSHKNKKFAIA